MSASLSFQLQQPLTDKVLPQTLTSFLCEAGLPPDAGSISKGSLTIEKILEEKKLFDLSVRFEKLGTGNEKKGWSKPGMLQGLRQAGARQADRYG